MASTKLLKTALALISPLMLFACSEHAAQPTEAVINPSGHSAPTAATIANNLQILNERPFSNVADFENARRGLIAQSDNVHVMKQDGTEVWNISDYDFIDSDGLNAPGSVNPSLWRQAALNNIHGLFEVTEGVYQIRGYDLANMSIIEGDTGWILVDPLTTSETAAQALRFAREHLGDKPVRAILFTHSHIDHFGGVDGILSQLTPDEAAALEIIAPEGFEEEATSENIIAGTAMGRRAMLMYGKSLARDERGHIGTGLGKSPAFGTFGIAMPTRTISETMYTTEIDGVPFEFQIVSGSEAPSEFTFYLPEQKAFCGAEMLSHNMHNLYTLRGAKVRDAKVWSGFIEQARSEFSSADVYFASHHWPIWGQDNINEFLEQQRDTYKFIHDQSVRMMNMGFTPNEIAEHIALPEALNQHFYNQGYYGTIRHNAKAVYQAYMGWYDANPANLDPLPELKSAIRTIDMMGGVEQVLLKARQQFDAAALESPQSAMETYRWLAELLNKLVFVAPENKEARELLATVYDQLGYVAESAPWRDVYLSGAYELRHGTPEEGIDPSVMKEVLMETPVHMFFDSLSVRLNADKVDGESYRIMVTFRDLEESYLITVDNSVMHHRLLNRGHVAEFDAHLKLTQKLFVDMAIGQAGLRDTLFGDDLEVEGSTLALLRFFSNFDKPNASFNIVTP